MRHIPNILSALRILLIPVFGLLLSSERTFEAALVLAFSGLTDTLDGFLARRFGWVTQLGKVLDPAADKLTQIAVSVLLSIRLHEYWRFFAILLCKEAIMLILGGYLVRRGVRLSGAKWFGKLGTVLFYVSATLLVFLPHMPQALIIALLGATTACSLMAAFMYLPEFFLYRRQIGGPTEESV